MSDEASTIAPERQEDLDKYAEARRRADERAELIAAAPPILERGIIYLVALALAITMVVLYFGKTSVVVTVQGKILPEGNLVSLQSRQGGVAQRIFAHAGDHLQAGAPVLQIDVSQGGPDLAELKRKQAIDEAELAVLRETVGRLDRDLSSPKATPSGEAAIARSAHETLAALENAQAKLDAAIEGERSLPASPQLAGDQAGIIRMPVEGTLSELKIRAAGEIVSAGATIATVAPIGAPLMVEANLAERDFGLVRPGIAAQVKVDAFPFQQFGTARATVVRVLPAFGGSAGFVVQLKLLDQKLTPPGREYYLFPGLSVQADLIAKEQRLLDALFKSDAAKPAP
jgi:multidrug efflux pump subunit AcrA (membrane-fusion protein)